ncbi:TlpA disulfide reductase family protein [Pigmentiphaga soli]|uniref:TlpA disulfide reductase family protein n=1 Tax=Pigmentiphaga soli TaxID=1007095 RepID=A0ABP8HD92_9BURK
MSTSSAPVSSTQRGAARLAAALALAAVAAAGAWFTLAPASPVPDTTFTSIQGEKFTTESLRGKVVLVNFWATSCETCVKEMPMMIDTYKKYAPQGYEMVAVAMSYDPPNYVLNYAQTRGLPFRIALDPQGEIARRFDDVKLTPTSFLIDKQGRIVKRYLGEPDVAEFHAEIEKALKG